MKFFTNTLTKGVLCAVLATLILVWGVKVQALENDSEILENYTSICANIGSYSYGFYTITEGMRDYPIAKQLSDTIPFSFDVSIIVPIGWTADKLFIKATELPEFGDRLIGIAVAKYNNGLLPYFGSTYSSSTDNAFEIVIPMYPPAITVYLITGYWGRSLGENPYAYEISLSLPE
jgi:hypothetical protein